MTGLVLWVIASAILLFVGIYWVYMLEKRLKAMEERYQKILALAEDTDQATIVQFLTRLDGQEKRLDQAEVALRRFGDILPHTIQGHGVVRYSAFENVGGDQSFSLALVDAHGNGAMLSGLHRRDDTRVYAKPLTQWRSSYSLSAEEQQALGRARQMIDGASPGAAPSDAGQANVASADAVSAEGASSSAA
jgi:cbb3-type cytochrome oxidase subunit 3